MSFGLNPLIAQSVGSGNLKMVGTWLKLLDLITMEVLWCEPCCSNTVANRDVRMRNSIGIMPSVEAIATAFQVESFLRHFGDDSFYHWLLLRG